MFIKTTLISLMFVLSIFVALPVHSRLTVYDDFKGPYLSQDLWYVHNQFDAFPNVDPGIITLEGGLRTRSGKLNYYNRNIGASGSESGRFRAGRGLVMKDGTNITAMETSVQVKGLEITGCTANASPSRAEVRIGGAFFNNAGSCEGSGSVTGDVQAYIGLRKDSDDTELPAGYMRAIGTVLLCTNANCTSSTQIGEEDLGLVKVGKKVKLLIRLEKDEDTFIFKLDKKGAEIPISYAVYSDTAAPYGNNGGLKRLEVTHLLATCKTGPETYGWIDDFYDYIAVNP